jgi:RNA polymerase sigma-70 factor (ECF subfamily)
MADIDPYQLRPLLDRVLAGDPAAYNDLLARLRPFLHARVRQLLGANPAGLDASALVQSALLRIHRNFDALLADDPTVQHLLAWVKTIIRNRVIDALRRASHDPLAEVGQGENRIDQVSAPSSAEEAAEREGRAARLARALAGLPQRQRQVVELHWFEQLPDSEISARLGGSVAAIRVLRCRALKELRRRLEKSHDDQ